MEKTVEKSKDFVSGVWAAAQPHQIKHRMTIVGIFLFIVFVILVYFSLSHAGIMASLLNILMLVGIVYLLEQAILMPALTATP